MPLSGIYPDGHPAALIGQNTQTSNLNAAAAAALIDFAIELSYGDPGETKRLRVISKPNTNSNHALPIGKSSSVIAKIIYKKIESSFPV